ncbi:MAG: metal-dependent transcriptional regulator [Lachnospiraceae bacterium]|nr:metal-dependent transcriptional regulator [Lachnospiraceae bacterium]
MKESAQNYLETILLLEKSNGVVRSIDVAKTLGVTKPSVSRAMGKLKDAGLVEMDENNKIVFTKKGKKEAEAILEKHETVMQFLMMTTDVSEEVAREDAAKISYAMGDEVYAGVIGFIKQVEEYHEE